MNNITEDFLQTMSLCVCFVPASVHLPRIGYNTPGFNWYGTERLIGKHLASKRIPTFMYPFVDLYSMWVYSCAKVSHAVFNTCMSFLDCICSQSDHSFSLRNV